MQADHSVTLDIWSDYVCPFCYLELPVIDRLQQDFGPRLEVRWHAFELRPDPAPTLDPQGAYLHDIWTRRVYPMAHARGMTLHLPPVQPRSRKAFEAVEHARTLGHFNAMHRALFRAFFEEGRDIGDTETLLDVGAAAHLERDPLKDVLDTGRYTHRVLDQEQHARKLGIGGVPLTLVHLVGRDLSDAIAVNGAVEIDELRDAILQVAR
jgi:predicted DsbA family dithiol-disulfide isomerase